MQLSLADIRRTQGTHELTRASADHLVKLKHGIALSVCPEWCSYPPWEKWEIIAKARILAAWSALGPSVTFTAHSALALHGLTGWVANPDVVVRTTSRYPTSTLPSVTIGTTTVPRVFLRQSRTSPVTKTVHFGDLRVDSLHDVAIDFAAGAHPLEAFVAVSAILRKLCGFNRFTPESSVPQANNVRRSLLALLESAPTRRGVRRAHRILTHADPGCENVAEAALLWVLLTVAPEPPLTQFEVSPRGKRYFFDIALPGLRIAFEFDGMGKMGTSEAEFLRLQREMLDRQRILERAGWRIVRIQWQDFTDFDALRRRLADEIGTRTGQGPWSQLWKPVPVSLNGPERRFL
ncbi:hypothetical protein I6B53_00585 [Schaalia sp. 19OD2882]|uniref:hypothetical protein n=1 Tax=Schaalia sp. 19OD2882 TaxID=2794089 RepID=UPI001C1EAE02|nr:hypothetical protein [Schaalia sp. 19OD2882]QWW19677.1 hypothetical protein I6B53_00585 [Schaalia sp. 19OD2882]